MKSSLLSLLIVTLAIRTAQAGNISSNWKATVNGDWYDPVKWANTPAGSPAQVTFQDPVAVGSVPRRFLRVSVIETP